MTTMTIKGVRFTVTEETAAAIRRELEDARRERELREWLDSHTITDENYSDIFKDVYGFRPRWLERA